MNNAIHICICLGYESLIIPLDLINKGEKNVFIYSNRRDILRFCEYMKMPYIQAPIIGLRDAAINPQKTKNAMFKSLERINIEYVKFHITHKNFDIHSLIIALFASYGNVYFHKTEIDTEKIYSFKLFPQVSIKRKIKYLCYYWVLCKLLFLYHYKFDITYRIVIGQLVPVMKEKEMKRLHVNIVDYKNKHDFFCKVYSKFSIDIIECNNLFVHTDINEMSVYATKTSIEKVYNVINKFDVMYKLHPNRDIKLSKKIKQYPSYIPAELLVNHTRNAVVGLISAVFRYSIKNKQLKTISCIELVDWKDKKKKQFYLNLMNEWGEGIIYPKTFDELSNLLKG